MELAAACVQLNAVRDHIFLLADLLLHFAGQNIVKTDVGRLATFYLVEAEAALLVALPFFQ